MPPIERTSCPGTQPSSAAYLAALIDERARVSGRSPGAGMSPMKGPDANVLIWVEEDASPEGGPPVGRHRGMIIVAHGHAEVVPDRSFVISYPVETDEEGQRIPAVSGVLEGMGWSVLAARRSKTALGYANTAILVDKTRPGPEQRLLLAEPIPALHGQAHLPRPKRPRHAPRRPTIAATAPGRMTATRAPFR